MSISLVEKGKILLVDDNKGITDLLSKFLIGKGYQCTTSNDGRNALNVIQGKRYDVILLDVAMPEFSGYHVIDALEKDGKLSHEKVILFTASSISNEEVDELIKRGVHSCLRKPVSLEELLQSIESTILKTQ